MKTISLTTTFAMAILLVFANLNVNGQTTFELPFYEDWSSGSFETNQWQTDDDFWQIDLQTGNPLPSVRFLNDYVNNYSSSLISASFDAEEITVEQVYLEFELKHFHDNASSWEKLFTEVFDGTQWHTIKVNSRTTSFDWTRSKINISNLVKGKIFSIRFFASAIVPGNSINWYIDNIKIYSECANPVDLSGEEYSSYNPNVNGSKIKWFAPDRSIIESGWRHYDSGENTGGIGGPVSANAAIRWDMFSLSNLHMDTIEKIKFFLYYDVETLVVKVWNDTANINGLIYSDTIEDFVVGVWNKHILNEVVLIDSSKQLLVGYSFYSTQTGIFPLGHDEGPAVAGYGDLISSDGGITWDYLSDFGPDFNVNWNIQMFVDTVEVSYPTGLEGFNILKKKPDEDEYHQIDFVEFHDWKSRYSIIDTCYDELYTCDAFYKVNALWVNDGDTCTSDFAPSLDNPEDDFVYVMFVDIEENEMEESDLLIFPNPTSSTLNIKSESKLQTVSIFNLFGQKVGEFDVAHKNELQIDVSKLKSGVYLLKAFDGKATISSKFIIQ